MAFLRPFRSFKLGNGLQLLNLLLGMVKLCKLPLQHLILKVKCLIQSSHSIHKLGARVTVLLGVLIRHLFLLEGGGQ